MKGIRRTPNRVKLPTARARAIRQPVSFYEAGRRAFYAPAGSVQSPPPDTPAGKEWLRGFRSEASKPTGIPGTPLGPDYGTRYPCAWVAPD